MPINCPHCQADIQSKVDETLRERLEREDRKLKAKDDELKLVSGKLAAAQQAAAAFETERAELGELRKAKARAERVAVLGAHKIPESALEEIELLYDARMAGREEGERVAFDAFLGPEGEGRKSVLLAGYFTDAASTAGGANPSRPGGAAGAASSGPGTVGSSNGGAAPAGTRGRNATPKDLQNYFASPEYKALPPEKKREKLAELKASQGSGLNGPSSPV